LISQSNALLSVEGLSHLKQLRVLYLHQNRIASLFGLSGLDHLHTLNVNVNALRSLKGVAYLPALKNLYAAKNMLTSCEAISDIQNLRHLNVLDLADNRLDGDGMLYMLKQPALSELSVLTLSGNPLCQSTRFYRKTFIAALEPLKCLDGIPVEQLDRKCAQAFLSGGKEAELAVRECARQEKRDAEKRDRAALRRRLAEGRARRLAREGRLEEGLEDVMHALVRSQVNDEMQSLLRLNSVVCSVCTQDFAEGEEYVTLPCAHIFHMHCILRWVSVR
jgi:dynein assembly factor 1